MSCFVYFIQSDGGGPVKIGIALDPQRRLAQLQTAHPYRLVIRRTIEQADQWKARDAEARLHSLFAAYRLMGEWFAPASAVATLGDAVCGEINEFAPYPEQANAGAWRYWSRDVAGDDLWEQWRAEVAEAEAQHKHLYATDSSYRLRCDELELLWDGAPITARPPGWEPDDDRNSREIRRLIRDEERNLINVGFRDYT